MTQNKSKQHWLKQHLNDPYVKRAQREGLRSRAAYKLLEIQNKNQLIRPGMTVIDIGAAPGSWSQLASRFVGPKGSVYALDILPMPPLPKVIFFQGDFREASAIQKFLQLLQLKPVDLVISDIALNLSGIRSVDQPRSIELAELVLTFTQQVLISKGRFVIKVFQGEGFEAYLKKLRGLFQKVSIQKPVASRGTSTEVYLVAIDYHFRGVNPIWSDAI